MGEVSQIASMSTNNIFCMSFKFENENRMKYRCIKDVIEYRLESYSILNVKTEWFCITFHNFYLLDKMSVYPFEIVNIFVSIACMVLHAILNFISTIISVCWKLLNLKRLTDFALLS